jgi:hypothetical protein
MARRRCASCWARMDHRLVRRRGPPIQPAAAGRAGDEIARARLGPAPGQARRGLRAAARRRALHRHLGERAGEAGHDRRAAVAGVGLELVVRPAAVVLPLDDEDRPLGGLFEVAPLPSQRFADVWAGAREEEEQQAVALVESASTAVTWSRVSVFGARRRGRSSRTTTSTLLTSVCPSPSSSASA